MDEYTLEPVPPLDPALAAAALAFTSDGIVVVDAEARLVFANEAAWSIHGDLELGMPLAAWAERARVLTLDGRAATFDELPLPRALRTGRTVAGETWRLQRLDGSEVTLRITATPVHDPDGRLVGATLVLCDVTQQHADRARIARSDAARQENERRMAAIIASAMDAIITVDADQRVVLFNHAAERAFGVRADEVMGQPLDRFIPQQLRARHRRDVATFGDTGDTGRSMGHTARAHGRPLMALRADGTEFPIDAAISQVETPSGRLYTVILRDISDRLRADEERERLIAELDDERRRLAALAAQAEAASSAKTAFLATMSHELRTPLNAILGYTELMEIGLAGPVSEVQRAYHERVRHSARHLLDLISEVLDLSKVEAGQLTVHRERVQLLREASAAIALVRPQAAARRLRLGERALCDAELAACADAGRVRQVLVNLLSNAVKFTPEGGTVLIECGQDADGAWVRVVDTGIGIPTGQLEQIFEPFVQATDDATSPYRRTQGGTGLGLAISRQLARLMDGDLVVESTPRVGSTFTLRLPVWDRARAEAPGVTGRDAGRLAPRHVRLALGSTLAACADHIVKTWADRLRVDPDVPQARDRTDADIENHVGAFLADFAQHFVILDEPATDRAALVRDGVKIQRVIAELHGDQRARLGWTEAALVRELHLLVEEIDRTLREKLGSGGELDDSLALVRAFLREAGRETVEAFRVARAARAARDAA